MSNMHSIIEKKVGIMLYLLFFIYCCYELYEPILIHIPKNKKNTNLSYSGVISAKVGLTSKPTITLRGRIFRPVAPANGLSPIDGQIWGSHRAPRWAGGRIYNTSVH